MLLQSGCLAQSGLVDQQVAQELFKIKQTSMVYAMYKRDNKDDLVLTITMTC